MKKKEKKDKVESPKIKEIPVHCSFTEMRDVATLVEHPRNPNQHSEDQIALLAKIIAWQGFRNPIVISKRSGFIVCGHGRLMAAKLLGVSQVPVDLQDFPDEAAEMAHLLADNRLAELSERNMQSVRDLLSDLDGEMGLPDITLTGYDIDVLLGEKEPEEDEFDGEPIEEPVSVLGDMWTLGDHRIICGDCTDALVVEKLLHGEEPHLMVTDPPYGVNYDPTWRDEAGGSFGNGKTTMRGKVDNDDRSDWYDAWALFPGDVAYIWHASLFTKDVLESLQKADFERRAMIVWAKQHFTLGRGHYHWQHELCWYVVRKGNEGHWNGARDQTTLWEIDNLNGCGRKGKKSEQEEKTSHGTQKPVECMARPMRNNSKVGDLVYEPFSGSGTTIIAGEQLGRKVRAIELNPAYVDMAVLRWQHLTNKVALHESGKTYDEMKKIAQEKYTK